jgi:long-chain fatty acid transport protein
MKNLMKTMKSNEKKMEATMKTLGQLFLIITLAMCGAISSIQAASGKGTSGAQFLRIGAGARAPGMGGAFSPIADDATAIYWNPGGLSQLSKREVSLSYNS